MNSARRTAKSGLTLLEALVALAIIGSSFGAILDLQAQLSRSLRTIEAAHIRSAWSLNAVEVAAAIEQDNQRTGSIAWPDGSRIEWRPAAEAESWTKPERLGTRRRGARTVTLAPIEFTVARGSDIILRAQRYALTATALPDGEAPRFDSNLFDPRAPQVEAPPPPNLPPPEEEPEDEEPNEVTIIR